MEIYIFPMTSSYVCLSATSVLCGKEKRTDDIKIARNKSSRTKPADEGTQLGGRSR